MEQEMKKISQILSPDFSVSVETPVDAGNETSEAALTIALHILQCMKEQDLVERLTKCKMNTFQFVILCRYKVHCYQLTTTCFSLVV